MSRETGETPIVPDEWPLRSPDRDFASVRVDPGRTAIRPRKLGHAGDRRGQYGKRAGEDRTSLPLQGNDRVAGLGMRVRGALGFLIREKVLGFLERRRQTDVAIFAGAKIVFTDLHEVDGHHDGVADRVRKTFTNLV